MPDSRAFWEKLDSVDWNGPYYGYQTVDLLLGESDTAHLAGHYANWLKEVAPGEWRQLLSEYASGPVPEDLEEIWQSAMPVELHYNTWISDLAVSFLDSMAIADGGGRQPFYLFVSYPNPHHPFDPPSEYAARYDWQLMPMPAGDGKSLRSLLKGASTGFREFNLGEHHPTARKDLYNQMVQTRKWCLPHYPEHPEWDELFDLETDPGEHVNLFQSPPMAPLVKDLSSILKERLPPEPNIGNEAICKW